MEEELANLYITDGEEEPFQIKGEVQALVEDYKLCWVGSYMTKHDLPLGLMSKSMAWKFGIFLGTFLDYDAKKVVPRMKRFQYEKISLFYFTCGKLGHRESFYSVRVTVEPSKITFGWDISLRALWRIAPLVASQWLREPGLTIWEPAINTVGPNNTRLMELGLDAEDSPFSFFDNKNKQCTIGEIPIVLANVNFV
ncbi:hypothetical protein J1N35_008492 [Gossypium stocksii]|uniref:DUF4283 domain-containing protein n=1 Tax=Gossypium stocksii TaxID=47602 RepID=A0A9D3W897_9ROSI|nr:hypothetical protein J1N35_008492 [Gossypium stocksii]